jgi:hypothetical protein
MLCAHFLNGPYDYLFSNCQFFYDFAIFNAIFGQAFTLYLIKYLYYSVHIVIAIAKFAWTAVSFWFVFYHKILTDPRGRSLTDMIRNPQNADLTKNKIKRLGTEPPTTKSNSCSLKVKFYNRNLMVLSAPQSHGAYAHVDDKGKRTHLQVTMDSIHRSLIHYDDPLRLTVAYEYVAKRNISNLLMGLSTIL